MTTCPTKSHVVLQDLKHAIVDYDCLRQAEAFRISWIAVISLARAVGHVLKKVDAATSPELKRAIDEKWTELIASKPEPKIFWGFIEYERNRFLKEYEHGITRTVTVASLVPDVFITLDLANARGGTFSPLPAPESYLSTGPFARRNEKDVAWEAYRWWQEYLRDVEHRACAYAAQRHPPTTPSPPVAPPSGS